VNAPSFTPGPWKATSVFAEATEQPWLIWSEPRDRALAQCYRISEAGDDNAAEQALNAKLIAASPDLLRSVQQLLHWLDKCHVDAGFAGLPWPSQASEAIHAARDVLRKAVGSAQAKP
jgi:hypothetical protein